MIKACECLLCSSQREAIKNAVGDLALIKEAITEADEIFRMADRASVEDMKLMAYGWQGKYRAAIQLAGEKTNG